MSEKQYLAKAPKLPWFLPVFTGFPVAETGLKSLISAPDETIIETAVWSSVASERKSYGRLHVCRIVCPFEVESYLVSLCSDEFARNVNVIVFAVYAGLHFSHRFPHGGAVGSIAVVFPKFAV